MEYNNVVTGVFVSRPNRFIANVFLGGKDVVAHVPNTGRCKELLVEGTTVYLEPSTNPNRKTAFSLIAVEKGGRIINMDSSTPNKMVHEALEAKTPLHGFPFPVENLRSEYTYKDSRLDLFYNSDDQEVLVEVKGVTLEENDFVFFPDAPTLRGVKHIETLITAHHEGYLSILCFVVQMEAVNGFSPNNVTQPQFGEALCRARDAGVVIVAFDSIVTPSTIKLNNPVPIVL